LQRFFKQKGKGYYSRKIADEFVSDSLNAYQNSRISISQYQRIRKVVAILGEYKNTGEIKWKRLEKRSTTPLANKNFENIFAQYFSDMNRKERYSPTTIKCHRAIVKQFLHYIKNRGHRKISCLTRTIVNDYIPVVAKRRPGGMADVINALKLFFKYLYDKKHIDSDLVSVLPTNPPKRKKHFVGFTREEANTLIDSVPPDTSIGKRTIAIFTLAESTGLRAVDVANLKLSDIDWRNKTISIIQHKTRRPLTLPFENHVGNALAEYILYGRPESDSPFTFLTVLRPFRPLSTDALSVSVSRCIKLSGIENKSSFRKGFHCFRRSIGTWLLEAELPLTMISEILGHSHINSAKSYLSTDHERLRECALGLEGIEIREGLFQ